MADISDSANPITRSALLLAPYNWVALLFAVFITGLTVFVPERVVDLALFSMGGGLAALVLVIRMAALWDGRGARDAARQAASFIGRDAIPGLASDQDGEILYANQAAQKRFDIVPGQTLAGALSGLFASPAAVMYRLQSRATQNGAAQEDIVARRGHVRISVHRFAASSYCWRVDEVSERMEGRVAETLSLPLLTTGRNGTILFMNEAARRVLGGRPTRLDQVFVGEHPGSGAVATIKGAGGPVSARIVEIEGRAGRREIYFLPLDSHESSEAAGGFDRNFWESLPVALVRLSRDGMIKLTNTRARAMLRAEDGAQFSDHVTGLGRPVADWLDDVVEHRVAAHAEVLQVVDESEERFIRIVPVAMVVDGCPEVLAVLHDATEQKSLEEQFVQSQKMQAIGQLAGGVAHDFNNLLTAISGHCDLLLLRRDQGDPDYGDLTQISQNANRAASLVGQLLAFSRKQTLCPEVFDLRDTLTDLTHLLNRLVGEKLSLVVSNAPDLAQVRADKRQLEQVIVNLVVNARDAMEDGGEIRIETTMHHLREPLRRDRAEVPRGDYVLVRVSDEGSGIAPDKLQKIFEPFYTTKGPGKGTGLGLSTVYGIVKQSGGYIFVDSVLGAGTSFTLYMPARSAKPEQAKDEPARTPPGAIIRSKDLAIPGDSDLDANIFADLSDEMSDGDAQSDPTIPRAALSEMPTDDAAMHEQERGDEDANLPPDALILKRVNDPEHAPAPDAETQQREGVVLLVEDEAPVRAFAARALRLRGYTVLEAGTAEEALEALDDPSIGVDVFVTDVVMPGMDGPTWVKRALSDRPDTRVVFVSGYAEESFADTKARIPNSVFLPKPFSLTELTATVGEQLGA